MAPSQRITEQRRFSCDISKALLVFESNEPYLRARPSSPPFTGRLIVGK